MAKPLDWLGKFIENELEAVVRWRNSTKNVHDAKLRFEDDGSNLRSAIGTTDWPPESIVQITNIVSCRTPIVVVITDGHTQVKAKLFDSAIRTLESEIHQTIDLETTNDVISIRDATVASTPYGPKDEHVQLEIHGLEYKYHLRKSLGPTLPILQRPEVSRLVDEITEIRHQQYVMPENPAEERSTRAISVVTATSGASREDSHRTTDEIHRPQVQRSLSQIQSSSQSSHHQSFNTQNPIATQIPKSRKRKAPSLDEDGLEILQGNNLARPHGPNFSVPTTGALPSKRRLSNGRDKLLGLLKSKPQAATVRQAPTTVRERSAETDIQPARSSYSTPAPTTTREHSAEADVQPAQSSPSTPIVEPSTQDGMEQISLDKIVEVPEPTAPRPFSQNHVSIRSEFQNYHCRRIEPIQKTLLEKPDSWSPPLPGKHFPEPNIPIQLLTSWHDQLQASPAAVNSPRVGTVEDAQMAQYLSRHSSESGSDVSDSSDEELPWSQSQSRSQPSKRPLLPPDSSPVDDTLSSPSDPRTYRPSESQQAPLSGTAKLPPDSSIGSSLHFTPLQKQTHPGSSASKPPTHNKGHSLRNGDTLNSTHPSPSIAIRHHRSPGNTQTSPSLNRSQELGNKASDAELSSPIEMKAQRTPANSRQFSRPPTSASIVKATQLEYGDMEMEESVPRELGRLTEQTIEHTVQQSVVPSSERDPRIAHHQKRSSFFKRVQREEWLRANYKYDSSAKIFSIGAILSKYKARYPKDDIHLTELAEALEKVFPALYPDGSESAEGGLTIITKQAERSTNATSTKTPKVRVSSMDIEMTGTDFGGIGAATTFRGFPTEPGRRVAVGFTNGEDGRGHSIRASSSTTQSTPMGADNSRGNQASSANPSNAKVATKAKHVYEPPIFGEKEVSKEQTAESTKEERRRSNFEDFESAMRNVGPGGAFAEVREPLQMRRRDGGGAGGKSARLNVTHWDI